MSEANQKPAIAARIFDRLIGHEAEIESVLGAIEKNHLASSLLLAGPSGVGKKIVAMGLTQALLCENSRRGACGECGSCRRVERGQSEGLLLVEPQGLQIKIEQSREILQFLQLQKISKARVVVIDQAHLLNPQAANALLKIIEEPPSGTYFILISPYPLQLLPTIRSRVQMLKFKPLSHAQLTQILQKVLPQVSPSVMPAATSGAMTGAVPMAAPDATANAWVLKSANGSVEEALKYLQQSDDLQDLRILAMECLLGFDTQKFALLKESFKDKTSALFVVRVWQSLLRDLFIAAKSQNVAPPSAATKPGKAPNQGAPVVVQASSESPFINADATEHFAGVVALTHSGQAKFLQMAQNCISLEQDILHNTDRQLAFDCFFMQWCRRSLV